MNKIKKFPRVLFSAALSCCFILLLASCDDTESYSDLLKEEDRACNWYLAQHRVELTIPEDSNFEYGDDAPFYRMDDDGYVYMQVITKGDMDDRPESGDKVLFRFSRRNIKTMYDNDGEADVEGNMDNMASSIGATYFFYGNTILPNTTQFGTGIQLPMDYLGYYSEVNLVLKSYSGFTTDQSSCIPYIINIKYYKPEY